MKQYINRDILIGFSGGGSKKELSYPLRVGRKQKRAVLDANGIEIVIFSKGQEDLAQLTCDLLNHKHVDGVPWLLSKCEEYQQKYFKADELILRIFGMSPFKRLFCGKEIMQYLKNI